MSITTAMNCPACEGEGVVAGFECATCDGSGEVDVSMEASASSSGPAWDGEERRAVAELPADEVTTALAEVSKTNTTISEHLSKARELGEQYRGVAFAVATVKGMDEATKARAAIREHRYDIQKLQKTGSKMLGTMQRQFNSRAEEVIAEIVGLEAPIHEQIQAEEDRKETARKEREEAEGRRIKGHVDAISAIARHVAEAVGEESGDIQKRIDGLAALILDESWEEFQGQATQARDEAVLQLQGLLVAARAEEAELEEARQAQARLREAQAAETQRLAAEREAQEARQREQDAAAATLAEERAQFEREKAALAEQQAAQARAVQERKDAVQRRIDAIHAAGPEPLDKVPAELIAFAIRTMQSLELTRELLDDRVDEAQDAVYERIGVLQAAHTAALFREAEEVRQARAEDIQRRLDGIARLERAWTAAQAPTDILDCMDSLADMGLGEEAWDDRASEAAALVSRITAHLKGVHALALERVNREQREADDRIRQEAAQAAAREKNDRIVGNATAMYGLLLSFIQYMGGNTTGPSLTEMAEDARAIRAHVEGVPRD